MIFFIILCLLLFQTTSSASYDVIYEQTIDNINYSFIIDSDVYQAVQSSMLNDNDYYWIAYYEYEVNAPYHWNIFAVDKANVSSGFKFLLKRNASNKVDFWNSNQNCTVYFADYVSGQPLSFSTFTSSNLTRYNYYCVEDPSATYYFFGNIGGSQLQTGSNTYTNIDFVAPITFTPPSVLLPNDTTDDYISGEFDYFILSANDSESFYFYLNDGTMDHLLPNQKVSILLSANSPYKSPNTNDLIFLIPKNILGAYYNGHIYNLQLGWYENNVFKYSTVISWTTDFSSQAILNDDINYQENINNFLTDSSVSNTTTGEFTDSMPNSSSFTNPADEGLNVLFNSLQSAFTNTNASTVRFYIPFTDDQYIDLPPDIVSSHLPEVIINLIQLFYWFLICRYIVKDISNTANKAKSGELLDSKDGNVKTELL